MKNTKLLILTAIVAGIALPSLLIAQDILDGDLGIEFAADKPATTPSPAVTESTPKTVPLPILTPEKTPAVVPSSPVKTPTPSITQKPVVVMPKTVTPLVPVKPIVELPEESNFQIIDGIPFGTSLKVFKSALIPAAEATFDVYTADGTKLATDLKAGYIVRVVAGDKTSTNWYKILFAPNTDPSFISKIGEIDEDNGVLREVPFGTTLPELMNAIVPAPEASCQVFQPDGMTVATDVLEGFLLNCTAGDMVTQKTVSISFAPNVASTVATSLGKVNEDKKTISEIPFGTSLDEFLDSLIPAPQAEITLLRSDALSEAKTLKTGYFLMVTAGDGKHQQKYRIEFAPNTDASIHFSLDALLKLLTGKK